MDAHACFTGSSVGLSQSPITALPTAIAPEETKTTSFPEFLISIRILTSFSIFKRSNLPVCSCISEDEPIFITILFLSFINSL